MALLVVSGLFVILRLLIFGRGNPASFVVAGTAFVDPHAAPHRLPVSPGAGYDGQFYYRLALNPLNFAVRYRGIALDGVIRVTRIGYPAMVWLASLGHAAAVPFAAIAVNLVGMFALGTICACWARSHGRHAAWGLIPAGYFGFVWTLARDLTEISAAVFLVAGIVALEKDHHVAAGLLLGAGALCRETVLLLVAAVAFAALGRRTIRWSALPSVIVPALMFGGWQLYVRIADGSFPLADYGGNSGVPFLALARAARGWLTHPSSAGAHQLLQLVILGAFVGAALVCLRDSGAPRFEKYAFGLYLLLVVCLSGKIWNDDPEQFRTFSELFILGTAIVMSSRRRLPVPRWAGCAGLAIAWTAAAAVRVHSA